MKDLCEFQSGQTSLALLDGPPDIVVMTPRSMTRPPIRTSVYLLRRQRRRGPTRCNSPLPFARNWGNTSHYWTMRMRRFGVHNKCFEIRSNYVTKQKQPRLAIATKLD